MRIFRHWRPAALLLLSALTAIPIMASLAGLKPHDKLLDLASLLTASAALAAAVFVGLLRER